MRTSLLAAVAILGIACRKDPTSSNGQARSTADADALWALAPDGTILGVVATPRALQLAEGGLVAMRKLFQTAPELAVLNTQIEGALATIGDGGAITSLADLGLNHDRGAAYFVTDGGDASLMIVPLGDRDKWLARTGGKRGAASDTIGDMTCKPLQEVYACAKPEAMFGRIGKGRDARTPLDLVKARGEVEIASNGKLPFGKLEGLAIVAQLERGAIVLRGAIRGAPEALTSRLTSAKVRADVDHTAAFVVANIAPFLADLPAIPLPGGVTALELAKTVAGPLTINVPNGELALDIRLPVSDPAPAAALIDHCAELAPSGILAAQQSPGACRIVAPGLNQEVDIWVEGKELRVGAKAAKPVVGKTVAMTPLGAEIAKHDWAFAFWGRGTMFSQSAQGMPGLPALPGEAAMLIRGISLLDELGLGVQRDGDTVRIVFGLRTIWANPDDVVAKLFAIKPEDIAQGRAGDTSKAIAVAAPGSPFANDFTAGQSGLMIPTAMIGMLAAIAIPAFVNYTKKSKALVEPPPHAD